MKKKLDRKINEILEMILLKMDVAKDLVEPKKTTGNYWLDQPERKRTSFENPF